MKKREKWRPGGAHFRKAHPWEGKQAYNLMACTYNGLAVHRGSNAGGTVSKVTCTGRDRSASEHQKASATWRTSQRTRKILRCFAASTTAPSETMCQFPTIGTTYSQRSATCTYVSGGPPPRVKLLSANAAALRLVYIGVDICPFRLSQAATTILCSSGSGTLSDRLSKRFRSQIFAAQG